MPPLGVPGEMMISGNRRLVIFDKEKRCATASPDCFFSLSINDFHHYDGKVKRSFPHLADQRPRPLFETDMNRTQTNDAAKMSKLTMVRCLAAATALFLSSVARADNSGLDDYFANWFTRVDQTQAEQPHWMTPLDTTTPRLEEEFRYDETFETLQTGASLTLSDSGKGLELIPAERVEVIIGLPDYEDRSKPADSGTADWSFLLVKYRLLSANEQQGNYILTAFLQGTAPTGSVAFTERQYVITPTLAAGKGWGDFDVQATLGMAFPNRYINDTGRAITNNVAFQYHLAKLFWPEVELNTTHWMEGERGGRTQIFFTPGMVLGRIPLGGRLKLSIGVGYQTAISSYYATGSATPMYNHAWVVSVRTPF